MTTYARAALAVEIADVSELIFSGRCTRLIAPATLGEVCILPLHAPYLTRLLPGEIRLRTEGGDNRFFFVSGGYMEVQSTSATVLADQVLRSDQIDREAALEAMRRAQEVLQRSHLFTERDQATLELVKALAQLRVLEHVHSSSRRRRGR